MKVYILSANYEVCFNKISIKVYIIGTYYFLSTKFQCNNMIHVWLFGVLAFNTHTAIRYISLWVPIYTRKIRATMIVTNGATINLYIYYVSY